MSTDATSDEGVEESPVTAESRMTALLRDMHPGWYASVMGTAILAITAYDNPGNIGLVRPVAEGVAVGFAVVAYLLGAVLLVAYAVRWARFTDAVKDNLRHPVLGSMHATIPAGLLVLAVMTAVVGPAFLPGDVVVPATAFLAVFGSALGLVVSVAFAYVLFVGEHPAAAANGGWFVPPVATVIIPLALMPLMPHVGPESARMLLALGYATFGMGFLLFLFTMGLLHDRLVQHPLPPAALAPSVWVGLGPVGVASMAPMALARGGADLFGDVAPTIGMISLLVSTGVWGFGLWWLAIAISLLVRYLRAGGVPFHPGWWAFTFPLGAYTAATLTLARAWQVTVLEATAAGLFVLLLAFWVTVSVRTVTAMRSPTT